MDHSHETVATQPPSRQRKPVFRGSRTAPPSRESFYGPRGPARGGNANRCSKGSEQLPPRGSRSMARGDRLAKGIGTGRHARLGPQGRAPEHGSSIPGGGAGGSAPRRETVGPSAPSPRQRTCTHEQRVPDPTGNGLSRSACATADAQHRSPQRTTGSGATRGGCQAQHRSPSARGASPDNPMTAAQ